MKDGFLQMRVDPEWLARLDAWRGRQLSVPDRSKAIRLLLERVEELEKEIFNEGWFW